MKGPHSEIFELTPSSVSGSADLTLRVTDAEAIRVVGEKELVMEVSDQD